MRYRTVRSGFVAGTLGATALLVWALWRGIDTDATHPALSALALGLFALNAVWISAAALTVLPGLRRRAPAAPATIAAEPAPCAVLWLICGEPPEPVAARARALIAGLEATGQDGSCRIFMLSDTSDPAARAREKAVFAPLGSQITYRNRAHAIGRKPGNLRDWLGRHGAGFETMLVLDADSGFSAERLRGMRARMQAEPRVGLIQSAIRLRAGTQSRFAALNRLSARLCGPVFTGGLARLSGGSGNFWGHNALIRIAAFREVAHLPDLPGRAPMGGQILSHDFVEAAFLCRAGWHVRIDPDSRGSFEDTPETIAEHLRRDRRWAQGNLQHLRLLGAPRLRLVSRLHLAAGIQSYLSAPVWLGLVLLFGSGAVHVEPAALWPFLATLALLLVPKFAGIARAIAAGAGTRARRRILWRAFGAELSLSTLVAPLSMIRRTGFVAAVLAGRDAGWTPSGASVTARLSRLPTGAPEALAGAVIMVAIMTPQALISEAPHAPLWAAAMIAPILLPLLAAPWLIAWLNRPRPQSARDRVAAYYDSSTRRFLAVGGSGAALAIHRPLWDEGVADREAAAAHVNTLIATAAEDALGQAPAQVRDLGCGVGGSLFHLARRWPDAQLTGLTLSATQAEIARAHAARLALSARCRILQSDFTRPPPPQTLPAADLVLAVESHVHTDSAESFLRAAQAHLRPGGVLIIVDDMLAAREAELPPRARRLVDAFRRGWRLGHVSPESRLADAARDLGYTPVAARDLTAMLQLDRWRDRALRVAGPVADACGLARVPLFANMIGGNALTEAYRAGIMRYQLVVLRAEAAPASDAKRRSAA